MDVHDLAQEWLRLDKDPGTRAEISQLVAEGAEDELRQRLESRITFGTAGARARDEAGFARINSLTVIQITQGLAAHLQKSKPPTAKLRVLIGYDGRRNSRRYASYAAAAFVAKDIQVYLFSNGVHTPLVAFGVRMLQAHAGVMITASHNPAADNGYKVYTANGTQINEDAPLIASEILKCLEPLAWDLDYTRLLPDPFASVCASYYQSVAEAVCLPSLNSPVVYTPLHGVGLQFLLGALGQVIKDGDAIGKMSQSLKSGSWKQLPYVRVPESQALPDPEFPTVKYPNPEEHGVLDIAQALADAEQIDLCIATDPDADRFAAAQRISSGWHVFKGDEIGALLGYYLWEKNCKPAMKGDVLMLTSAVSSQMLACIGRAEGFSVEETLTGFKWIGSQALSAEQTGRSVLFGYEEAMGYMNPRIAYDKDGVSAALLFLEACSAWSLSPYEMLESLYQKYGWWKTLNTHWRSPALALTKTILSRIQQNPIADLSAHCDPDLAIKRVRDLAKGTDTGTEDGKSHLPSTPDEPMITLWLEGEGLQESARCTIRASGTEAKIKGEEGMLSNQPGRLTPLSIRGIMQ